MSDISPISTSTTSRIGRVSVESPITNQAEDQVRGRGGARTNDRVEFSQVAQYLSQLQSEPAERTDLINRVRTEIQAGTYLSDEKLESATSDLLDDLHFEL